MALLQARAETGDGALIAFRHRPGPGPLVVFCHPHTGQMASFMPLLDVWKGNALVFDRRGYGLSTRGKDPMITQDADLALLLDRLGIEAAVLIGVAAGGAQAAGLAVTAPERVLALGLVSSFIGLPQSVWLEATGEARPEGDAARRELTAGFRAGPHFADWAGIAAENVSAGAGEPPQPVTVDVGALSEFSPLMLATGEDDRLFTPAMLTHASGLLPEAETHVFAGVAHAPHVENPAVFATWTDRLVSRASAYRPRPPAGRHRPH
ncbi:alpha/beta hydrolase [Martelella sp. HB161492]|uniref:alpha/beta fold hydrolase n=1 Tax=Martelella sp. HB161492 TaxID=2720726 RepID=UPI0015903325|nr:alpha/beta hydrolase [Martelella sp. HB161492]